MIAAMAAAVRATSVLRLVSGRDDLSSKSALAEVAELLFGVVAGAVFEMPSRQRAKALAAAGEDAVTATGALFAGHTPGDPSSRPLSP